MLYWAWLPVYNSIILRFFHKTLWQKSLLAYLLPFQIKLLKSALKWISKFSHTLMKAKIYSTVINRDVIYCVYGPIAIHAPPQAKVTNNAWLLTDVSCGFLFDDPASPGSLLSIWNFTYVREKSGEEEFVSYVWMFELRALMHCR